jgi:hypothetical protein
MILGPHTVVVVRAGTSAEDEYGNEIPGWNDPTETTVTGCSVQPVVGTENLSGRDTVVSRWQLFAPDGTDLLATDRVEWDGDTYEVDGEVQRWGFPPLSHLVALLRRGEDL